MDPSISLERARQHIRLLVGPEGARIADALMSRKEATDRELAEELGEKPSHIRKVLYDLYEARIAEYHKEKDKETGWLIFYWHVTPATMSAAITDRLRREIQELKLMIECEQSQGSFICSQGAERFDFARATEVDFRCPEHGAILQSYDNHQELHALRQRIEALQGEM